MFLCSSRQLPDPTESVFGAEDFRAAQQPAQVQHLHVRPPAAGQRVLPQHSGQEQLTEPAGQPAPEPATPEGALQLTARGRHPHEGEPTDSEGRLTAREAERIEGSR